MATKTDQQEVVVYKEMTIQSFIPEKEFKYLIERGGWELILTSQAFLNRFPEGQATKQIYEQFSRFLPNKAGVKVDFH